MLCSFLVNSYLFLLRTEFVYFCSDYYQAYIYFFVYYHALSQVLCAKSGYLFLNHFLYIRVCMPVSNHRSMPLPLPFPTGSHTFAF